MKKILIEKAPLILAAITLLIVSVLFRYNLYLNTAQLGREFLNQNFKEIYSADTLKLSNRLNSFSRALNWVCIEGEVNKTLYFSNKKNNCESGIFQQKVEITIPEANNSKISLTLKVSNELQNLYLVFFILQVILILSVFLTTQYAEQEKMKYEMRLSKLARKMLHDIRSPLAALDSIINFATFKSEQDRNIFKTSILRIQDTAKSMLESTRGRQILEPAYQNIYKPMMEVIAEKKVEHSNLTIDIHETEALALVELSEFKRIISNIFNNSVEANKINPKITIKVENFNEQLLLSITDNGCGIPQKILNEIGKKEITSKTNGNGIGLKNAIETLSEWGASVEIESSNNGTKIKIYLISKPAEKNYILIDDDLLTRLTWESRAKKAAVNLKTFSSVDEFNLIKNELNKSTSLYVDSELGNIKGENVAQELYEEGFTNIFLTTGHPAEKFRDFQFLKSVISKAAPF